jgi:hypothetical protein
VTLYDTLETLTLRGTDGNDQVAFVEDILDGDSIAKRFVDFHTAKLDNLTLGRGVSGSEVTNHLLAGVLLLTLAISQLYCVISVRIVGFHLRNHAGAGFDYGTGHIAALFVEDGSHSYLLTNNSVHWFGFGCCHPGISESGQLIFLSQMTEKGTVKK